MNHESTSTDPVPSGSIPLARPIVPTAPMPPSHPMLLAESTPRQAWHDLLLLLGVFVVTVGILQTLAHLMNALNLANDLRVVPMALTFVNALVLMGATYAILRRREQPLASVGLCGRPWWLTGLLGLVALVGAWIAMYLTVAVTCTFFPTQCTALTHNPERVAAFLPKLNPPALCALALWVGIYEEIICRGFLLNRLRRATGSTVAAVVVSSALFALPHGLSQAPITVVPLFLTGVVWAVVTLWHRSVIPAIIGHACFDLINLLYLYYNHAGWE